MVGNNLLLNDYFLENDKRMQKIILGLIVMMALIPTLSGCATQEEIRQKKEAARRHYMAQLQKKCEGFGFKKDTNAFAKCLQDADRHAVDDKRYENAQSDKNFARAQCYATGRLDCY